MCPSFSFFRKIDGTRTPRDERRRAQHNEGKVRVAFLGLTGTARPGACVPQISDTPKVRKRCLLIAGRVEKQVEVHCQEQIGRRRELKRVLSS